MIGVRRSAEGRYPALRWGSSGQPLLLAAQWPIFFVLGSLLLLAFLPLLALESEARWRDRAARTVVPARALISETELSLALGRSALRDHFATQAPALRAAYERSRSIEEAARSRLLPMIGAMDAPVAATYARFAAASVAWHHRAGELVAAAARDPAEARRLLVETRLYEDALVRASAVDRAIDRFAGALSARAAVVEQRFALASLVLVALALTAAMAVLRLGRITRRLAAEAEHRREEVERLMASRSGLMRGITHDLKNPLGAADGYAQLLQEIVEPPLTARQQEYVARIRESLGSTVEIIDRVLDVAREQGQVRIVHAPVDPEALLRSLVERHRAAFETAGLRLTLRVENAPRRIETDAARVGEVLGNLLSNASKYTPRGGQVGVELRSPRRGWLAVDVRDDGPGIPADQEGRVFEEFARMGNSDAPGAGVGLTIARRMARLLGGDLTLESGDGSGSTFTLWLPERGRRRSAVRRERADRPAPGS